MAISDGRKIDRADRTAKGGSDRARASKQRSRSGGRRNRRFRNAERRHRLEDEVFEADVVAVGQREAESHDDELGARDDDMRKFLEGPQPRWRESDLGPGGATC